MAINFNVQNASTGRPVTALNESRVDRILNASTLNEAQRMGLFDRLKDWCRGGVKAQAIREIYDRISAPQSNDTQPLAMLNRFERLRSLVTDEHRTAFSVVHSDNIGAPNHWSFALRIGEAEVYHSGALNNEVGQLSEDFERHLRAYEGLNKSIETFRQNIARDGATVENPKHLVAGRVECMSDNEEVRNHITANLENPLFSRANFKGFEDDIPGESFLAVFQQEGGEPVRLVLSDRDPSMGEFRSHILRDALRGEPYGNLQDLLSRGHLTEHDPLAVGMLKSGYFDLYDSVKALADPENERPSKEQVFNFLRDLQPVKNPWFELLRNEKFGELNMLDVFFPDSKAQAEDLVLFDAARELLKGQWVDQIKDWTKTADSFPALNRGVNAYVLENTQDLVDDAAEREKLTKLLDDPNFNHGNFKEIQDGVPGKTFKAVFEWDGQQHVLELSNRVPSAGEFRGQRVKDILQSRDYSSLREVLSTGYQGAGDAILRSAANSTAVAQLAQKLELGDALRVPRFLQHLKDHGPAQLAEQTFDLLRAAQIKNTNLLELLLGDQAVPDRAPLESMQWRDTIIDRLGTMAESVDDNPEELLPRESTVILRVDDDGNLQELSRESTIVQRVVDDADGSDPKA